MTSGLNIIQGYAGHVSLCQIGFYGIGAYTSGLLMVKFQLPMVVGLIAAVLMGLIIGTIIGIPTLRTKGHYFSIATLSFTLLLFSLMNNWFDLTGGYNGFSIKKLQGNIFGFALSDRQGYYYLVLIFVIVTIAFVTFLMRSRTGRAIVTIRENENLAKAIGVNTVGIKLLAFDISAILACIAGVLYAHYMNYVNPTSFTGTIGMNAILAVMIGGCGTVVGPILGSAVVIFLPEILRMAELYRQLIFGVLLIIVVFLLPNGLVPPISKLIHKITDKLKVNKSAAKTE